MPNEHHDEKGRFAQAQSSAAKRMRGGGNEHKKAQVESDKALKAVIAAGFGHLKPDEIMKMDHPAAKQYKASTLRLRELEDKANPMKAQARMKTTLGR